MPPRGCFKSQILRKPSLQAAKSFWSFNITAFGYLFPKEKTASGSIFGLWQPQILNNYWGSYTDKKWRNRKDPSVPNRPPQFHTRTTPFQHSKSLNSKPNNPQFNTEIPQFHTKNLPVRHTSQFHTKIPSVPHIPQFYTKNPSVPHTPSVFLCWTGGFLMLNLGVCWTEGFLVLNWGVFYCWPQGFWCGTEECLELRGFWCGTEGFWGLKRSGPFVLNWYVELRGTPKSES